MITSSPPKNGISDGKNPAYTNVDNKSAVIKITSGDLGKQQPELQSNDRPYALTLADVFSHEIGHIDAVWYHGAESPGVARDPISNGDSVRMENQTRQLNAEPLRLGHQKRGDVELSGVPF